MTRLSQDYERMQSTPSTKKDLVDEYRSDFARGQISAAQGLIDSSNDYLVMDASKLNALVDTINYMQAFWAEDKDRFASWIFDMCHCEPYDTTKEYRVGNVISYSSDYYICKSDSVVSGTFNPAHWIKLGRTEVKLNFVGRYDSTATYATNDLTIKIVDNLPTWQYYDGSTWIVIGYMYGNLRFLTDPTQAYPGEVYLTPGSNR